MAAGPRIQVCPAIFRRDIHRRASSNDCGTPHDGCAARDAFRDVREQTVDFFFFGFCYVASL
jgi:hypothetical protein